MRTVAEAGAASTERCATASSDELVRLAETLIVAVPSAAPSAAAGATVQPASPAAAWVSVA